MRCLVLLQKKAIRVIARDKYVAHTQPRFREFNIMKCESIDIYLTCIFVYKYQNNHLQRMFLNYFVKITDKHDHYTRSVTGMGRSVKYCRTNYRGFALSIMGPKIWNTILHQIRQLNSLVQFKRECKKYVNNTCITPIHTCIDMCMYIVTMRTYMCVWITRGP